MSIFGAMNTSVSGMNAQSNRLSVLSENIANADTAGYKAGSTEFETILDDNNVTSHASGGVTTKVRYAISAQGLLQTTSTATNLAIQGGGFFVVSDGSGARFLTRAGAFVPDAAGDLVNSAGFRLMGVAAGASPATTSGLAALMPIHIDTTGLVSSPSTKGTLAANLPSAASAVAAANLPSANAAGAQFTDKTSLVAYDNLGGKVTLDVYLTKSGPNTWDVAVFDQSAAASGGGFPYSSGPLSVSSPQFDPSNGTLAAASASSLSVAVPGGKTVAVDLSRLTQLATGFSVSDTTMDGNAPSAFSRIAIDDNGVVSAVYQDGTKIARAQVVLANVPSPDNLTPLSGNVYDTNSLSGDAATGSPGTGTLGTLAASAVENSTVDIASELTTMIETQRSYTANSKAFQIGTDMADVLVNLKI
jgi:flagellar hook protein FlgE